MTILVTGGTGQLARLLGQAGLGQACGADVRVVGRPDFDFDRPDTLEAALADRPSLVVNAAAWTAVDAAEAEPDAAQRANQVGPATLAALCADRAIPLIHISTDYVFDGNKGSPYTETDSTSPTGIYGQTKLEGEQAVLAACLRATVLRTSWVYSAVGKNFVRTMLSSAQNTSMLRVVADQRGNPTSAHDLATAILAIADRLRDGWSPAYAGVFHMTGQGDTTWHGLAEALFHDAARHGRPAPTVIPITTAEWPTPARRPPDSRLDCAKLERVFGLRLPPWQASLRSVVDILVGPST